MFSLHGLMMYKRGSSVLSLSVLRSNYKLFWGALLYHWADNRCRKARFEASDSMSA